MKKLLCLLPAALVFIISKTSADDVEIYFNGQNAKSAPYIHFLLDWRPPVFAGLCVLPTDPNDPSTGTCRSSDDPANDPCPSNATCMSDDILENLTASDGLDKPDGASVNLFEAFVAILQAIFEDDRLATDHRSFFTLEHE